MAFNPQEQEIIRAGIASGKSQTEIVAALSSYRTGSTPRPVSTNQIDPRPFTQKLTDFVGMSKAADVTASHFARMGVGPGTAAENRAVIPAPTLKQNIGAGLQYGGLAFDAITTPLSVFNAVPVVGQAANAAINAFSGYLYETGQDLLDDEGYMEALKPGAITAASAVAGPLLYLGGKGVIAGGKGLMKGGGRVVGKGVDALRGVGRSPGIPPPSSGVISNVPTPTVPSKFDLADNKITYSKDGWKRNEVTETTGGVTKIVQEEEQVMDVSELPPDLRQRYLDALKGKELAKGTGIENAKNASDVFQKVVDDIAQHIGLTQPTKNIPQPGSQFADQGIGQVTDAVGDIGAKATSSVSPGGVLGTTGEFLGRVPRAIARGVDAFDEATTRAARIAESSPVVQQAIKSNLGDDIINFTQSADQAMTEDALKMVRIAETTPDALVAKQNPADIAGQAAAKQYQIVERERRAVGQKIGDLTDELAAQGVRVDMKPAYRQAIDVLRANGMLPKVSGKIKFSTKKYTPQQQDAIQKLYDLAMQEKIMSPTQVHEMDQLFSKLQKELLDNGKISDVYVKVPTDKGTMIDVNIFKVFRQIFSDHLSTLSPEMKVANAEYRKLKNLVEDIEATLVKKGNLRTNADVDPAEYARTNLRRIFSDAASAADYKAIYNKLDKLSRELGYEGSRADTLSLFASKLRDIYPETIPKNSFQGGISTGIKSGLLDVAERVLKTGAPDIRDQQKALRALLEDRANFGFKQVETPVPKTPETPTAKSEPESLVDDTTPDEIPEEAIVDTAKKIQRDLRNNPQGGYFNIVEMIKDVIGLGKRAKGAIRRKPESKMDREFRRKDEVYWESKGYRTTGDGRIEKNNRNRGMANFGAMAEDIAGVFKKKVADPTIRTKRAVDVKTVSGEKVSIPEGTVLNPMVDGSKVSISVNGKEVVMPKNQYQNLVGQSDRAIATPFAPELKETIETVLGDSIAYKNKQSIYFDDSRWGEGKVEIIAQDLDQRGFGNGEFTVWEGDKKLGDSMLYDEAVQFAKDHIDNSYPNATVDLTGLKADVKPQNTKYSSYTLPGGENYREIVVQAPRITDKADLANLSVKKDGTKFKVVDENGRQRQSGFETETKAKNWIEFYATKTENNFVSSHYPDDPNPLFHLRMNERTIKTANDTTFMEELQSDWAREGREKGFAKTYTELPEWVKPKETQAMGGVYKYEFDLPEGGKVQFNSSRDKATVKKDALKALNGSEADGIPNHPILKNWQISAVKRALMEAVDNKSNFFAWINGAQTSERYNLATHLEEAVWEKINDSRIGDIRDKAIELVPKSGGESIIINIDNTGTITKTGGRADGDWKGKKLDEVLGKGLADKIMEKETGTLSGEGLKFGGEWAENLYDKQVANIVKKLTGAEVKTVDLGIGTGKETRYKIYGSSTFATSNNVRKGDLIAAFSDNKYEKYYVLDSYGDGTVDLIPQREVELQIQNDEELYNKYYPKSEVNGEFINVSTEEMNDAFYRAIDDGNFDTDELVETVNLDTVGSQKQQYIELTPEVKAKIQSKAPNFSMKTPSVGESLPLLLLMLGGATYAGNQ